MKPEKEDLAAAQKDVPAERSAPVAPTDEHLRGLWRKAGGHFFGPHVEHGSMPERMLLPFLRALLATAPGGGQEVRTAQEPNGNE